MLTEAVELPLCSVTSRHTRWQRATGPGREANSSEEESCHFAWLVGEGPSQEGEGVTLAGVGVEMHLNCRTALPLGQSELLGGGRGDRTVAQAVVSMEQCSQGPLATVGVSVAAGAPGGATLCAGRPGEAADGEQVWKFPLAGLAREQWPVGGEVPRVAPRFFAWTAGRRELHL